MLEFFRGWKRKAGCVTLVLAYVFMAGWVRSQFVQDTFSLVAWKPYYIQLSSMSQRLFIAKIVAEPDKPLPEPFWTTHKVDRDWHISFLGLQIKFSVARRPFSTGGEKFGLRNVEISVKTIQLPYWSITFPLTALSAWLLLSKSRVRKGPATALASESA